MIKMTRFSFMGAILALGMAGSAIAQVKETPCTIGMLEGGNPRGYIQGANDQGVLFSTSSGGRGTLVTYDKIRGEGLDKLIRLDARAEALAEPRALFATGRYAEAAEAFGAVARNYAIILGAPQNFATEALFYQCESLLRAGNYKQLGQLIDAPAAATIDTKLSDYYKKAHEYQKLWGLLGKNDIEGLRTALAAYQQPVIGEAKLLPVANFNQLPATEIAQLAYLRAKVFEADGEKENALDDYYRSFTLAYGNNELMAQLAMGAVMVILKDDPLLKSEDKAAMAEMQNVAYLFSKRFGTDGMPDDIKKFAVRPEVARPVVPVDADIPVEDEAASAEGNAKDAGEKAPEGDDKKDKKK